MKPMILDRNFRYTPSYATNIRETFDRVRRELYATQPAWPCPCCGQEEHHRFLCPNDEGQ